MISKSELKRLCTTNPLRAAELMHLLQHRLEVAKDALLVANEINHEPGCLATFASHDGCDCAKSTVRCALEEIG